MLKQRSAGADGICIDAPAGGVGSRRGPVAPQVTTSLQPAGRLPADPKMVGVRRQSTTTTDGPSRRVHHALDFRHVDWVQGDQEGHWQVTRAALTPINASRRTRPENAP